MSIFSKNSLDTSFKYILIETKFNPPELGNNQILRQRLIDKLNQGLRYKLTLVTAPAGFGKSNILAEWASQQPLYHAWISLDKSDNNLISFWSYFIYALNRNFSYIGVESLDFLHSINTTKIQNILTILINEISHHGKDLSLILDDFHNIDDEETIKSLKLFIDYLPNNFHLYILSRNTSFLPLTNLIVKDHVNIININDLRFDFLEHKEYFYQNLKNTSLSQEELLILNDTLEGWVAGMQMTSIMINNTVKKDNFINTFLDKSRYYILDYFKKELIDKQSQKIKSFLLQTSILKQMNASLCSTLTESNTQESKEILQKLETMNLFVIPLDDKGDWYRYHNYFAKSLIIMLKESDYESYLKLHKDAGNWFKEKGLVSDAIYHAIESENYHLASEWIVQEASNNFYTGELINLLSWINSLPEEILHKNPILWLYYIWGLIGMGKIKQAEASCLKMFDYLDENDMNQYFNTIKSLEYIKNELNMVYSYLAIILQKPNAVKSFIEAVKYIQEDNLVELITFNTCSVYLLQTNPGQLGSISSAYEYYTNLEPIIKNIGNSPSFAVVYVILGEIYYEKNELVKANKYIYEALHLGIEKIDLGALVPAYVTASKIKLATGEINGAKELLNVLEREIYARNSHIWLSIFQAYKVNFALSIDDLDKASIWMNNCELSIDDGITILQHYRFVTLIRCLLCNGYYEKAMILIERMVVLIEEKGGIGQQIEILILQAYCNQNLDRLSLALHTLKEAISLGAKEGYFRIFIDEGERLFNLIKVLKTKYYIIPQKSESSQMINYIETLYQGFLKEYNTNNNYNMGSDYKLDKTKSLTTREWEVLTLLAKGSTNSYIAETLYISVVTVKTHVKNICRKLGVKNRGEAIARINELDLLS